MLRNPRSVAASCQEEAPADHLIAAYAILHNLDRISYIKGTKRQFFLHFFHDFFEIFWVPREAALAADLITA